MSTLNPADYCDIESESLDRYGPGGYHPVDINDTFRNGRYRVLQKLGWGGYSTVWLALDCELSRLAALKVVVSEIREVSNEARIHQHLALIPTKHEGRRHLRQLIDHFFHDGPNGRHQCLVFDVDGVSVSTLVRQYEGGARLPGRLAWEISKQVTLALDFLHSNGIAHGDLHPGNILVSQGFPDSALLKALGEPIRIGINDLCGYRRTENLPQYVVQSARFPVPAVDAEIHARLIDFEQSFLPTDELLAQVRTPLIFRAPETLLDSKWDLRMDIWSLACTIFELVIGQPPFDNFMPAKAPLILEWMAMFGNVPEKWRKEATTIIGNCKDDIDDCSLTDWLCETYFIKARRSDFVEVDIQRLGDLLTKMMCYDPGHRLSTQDILRHEWFMKNPLV